MLGNAKIINIQRPLVYYAEFTNIYYFSHIARAAIKEGSENNKFKWTTRASILRSFISVAAFKNSRHSNSWWASRGESDLSSGRRRLEWRRRRTTIGCNGIQFLRLIMHFCGWGEKVAILMTREIEFGYFCIARSMGCFHLLSVGIA